MFRILIFIIIISINKTYAYVTQDSEIILLPAWNLTGAKEISLTLKVFGKLMQLNLRRNDLVESPVFEVWKNYKKSVAEKLSELKASDLCLYCHEDHISSVVINFCQEHGLEGFIFMENDLLELRPAMRNICAPWFFIDDLCVKDQINLSFGKPHLIKRSPHYFFGSDNYDYKIRLNKTKSGGIKLKRHVDDKWTNQQNRYTVELAIVVDRPATISLQLSQRFYKPEKLDNMMYEFGKRIEALFYRPDLGVSIDIVLIYWEFLGTIPYSMWAGSHAKDADLMLKSVCNFSQDINAKDDDNPYHWDIFVLLTGQTITEHIQVKFFGLSGYSITESDYIDINYDGEKHVVPIIEPILVPDYSVSDSRRAISGKAYHRGACNPKTACAIVQVEPYEKHYFGIKTAFAVVRQIGRLLIIYMLYSLGLPYDVGIHSQPFIMSYDDESYRFDNKSWSSKSRNVIKKVLEDKLCLREDKRLRDFDSPYKFNNLMFHSGLPGRNETAKAQCELILKNQNANVVTLHDVCQNLHCETPHTNESHFFEGALEGTYCSHGKECRRGQCVPIIEPPYKFKYCHRDKWTEWKADSCKSSCLKNSKGVQVKRRSCKHRNYKTANCIGLYYDVVMCNDFLLCTNKNRNVIEFATIKCTKYHEMAKEADLEVDLLRQGTQLSHVVEKPWVACIVACYYNRSFIHQPYREMLILGVNPYFPDGTWCGNIDDQNYYCRRHYCLPEHYSFEE